MLNTDLSKTELSLNEYQRYSRQLLLPQVQVEGQKRLAKAKILCIGAGALGSPVIAYLAAAGIGSITIVDYDTVEISNLQRQIFYNTSNIGCPKTDSIKNFIRKLNPNCKIQIYSLELNNSNIRKIIYSHDVILDGTDNLSTRYLIDQFCTELSKPWIYGAVFQFEGQISILNYQGGPRYEDIYPKYYENAPVSCSEGGILGIVPGLIGLLQANEALKIVLGIGKLLVGEILVINLLTLTFKTISIRQILKNYNTDPVLQKSFIKYDSDNIINVDELKSLMTIKNEFLIIDVRSEIEFLVDHIPGASNYPLLKLNDLKVQKDFTKLSKPIIIYCSLDSRSQIACKILKSLNISCKQLKHGWFAWKKQHNKLLN
uniref:molybdopterin biosynthesis protein n=1 Tax=Rhodaphanes brevistipitata TaxID=446136 RepID=UPI001FCE01E3|nr:molybdopterin biosynthesis protein [Rhodaphanes brevistipitata]UNJ18501.1 molybdopterin biosynthesis protein [Rhodaphanes brevistipitata]